MTVGIVNWNTRDQLRLCLASIPPHVSGKPVEVRVVDNASSDGSAEMVAREFPHVVLRRMETNLGFAGGVNAALMDAAGPYALLLNPDVELTAAAVEALVAYLDAHPETAAVAPLLVGGDGVPHAQMYRRFPSLAQVLLFWTSLGYVTRRIGPLRRRIAEHDLRGADPVQVEQLPGAAMLFRTALLRQVGPWDPDYFIWFEDVDWSYRVRRAGHRLMVLPAVRVRHEGGASFGSWSLQKRAFQFYRTFFRFLCKHRLDRIRRVALPLLTADLLLREAGLQLVRRVTGREIAGVRTLGPTRRAMAQVVRSARAGRLPSFTDAGAASDGGAE